MSTQETKNVPTKSEPAQTTGGEGSEPRSRVPKDGTVCDFLYHDVRRISSFLSQFETYGVLQGVKASESVSRNQQLVTGAGAKGSVIVADANASFARTTGDTEQDAAERTYDPFWLNARSFLSHLDSWNLIEEDLHNARIGQFVQITGELAITDMGVAKSILALPQVKQKLRETNKKIDNKEIDIALSIFNTLPYAIHVSMSDENASAWGVLKEDCLSISPSDIFLKHGINMQGAWKMLGIMDACPDTLTEEHAKNALQGGTIDAQTPFSALVEAIAPMTRHLLGRPPQSFGVTPLMVYREVYG